MHGRHNHWFLALLVAPLMLILGTYSGARAADSLLVSNVQFQVSKDMVKISYDMNAPAGTNTHHVVRKIVDDGYDKYRILLVLKREQDPSFNYVPSNVRGDVGPGIVPGRNKLITWDLSKEFPEGLNGDDFYFVVRAEPFIEKSNAWLWIGGTCAVVGGTLAVFLFSRGGGGISKAGFPDPPNRPQ